MILHLCSGPAPRAAPLQTRKLGFDLKPMRRLLRLQVVDHRKRLPSCWPFTRLSALVLQRIRIAASFVFGLEISREPKTELTVDRGRLQLRATLFFALALDADTAGLA